MLLTKIILKDFGVYSGENEFDLTVDDDKPIILIGGTNGAGKTTLFDSVMLCLYGMAAFGKKITKSTYDDYLKRKIHRYLGATVTADHASIIIQFKFFHNHEVAEYRVERSWINESGKIIEDLLIKKRTNDESNFMSVDNIEKSHWQSFVEDLIPKGIARLFFFDGEKIVKIAEEGNEDIAIKSSFNSLLGIDLVEQLKSDLQINLSRNLGINETSRLDFERYQKEKSETESEIKILTQKKIVKESEVQGTHKQIDDLDEKISRMGGTFSEQRDELKSKKILYQIKLDNTAQNIRNICSHSLPLSLIPKQLGKLIVNLKNDESLLKKNFEKEILESNFNQIIQNIESESFWKEISSDKQTREKIVKNVIQIFDQRLESQFTSEKLKFDFSLKDSQLISEIISEANGVVLKKLESETQQLNELSLELDKIETALINAPKDDEIGPMLSQINELNKKLGMLEAEISHIDQQISTRMALSRHISVKIRESLSKQYKNKKSQEKAELTERILDVLDSYSEQLRIKKISLLEEYMLEGIKLLIHKDNFIEKIIIDKDTFEIHLFRSDGIEIQKDLLSKGEQQMFATSVLWALAKTSGRPLPFLIDTPLARLDVQHRTNLVEGFFPFASHQVVIFSTNAEIDAQYYKKMHPHITRAYSMNYLSDKGTTNLNSHYFWDENGVKLVEI